METREKYDKIVRSLYNLTSFEIKLGLDRVQNLIQALGSPHTRFKSIHIGGTNGKGSTAVMIESVLQDAGYKTGLFTSPHLVEFTERIRVNGQQISEEEVIKILEKQMPFIKKYDSTFFESTTSLAFDYYAQQKVDIAVVEVGMGGRLDATNILTPLLSVITPVGYEHQKWLGDTLIEIAGEKAGIIKKDSTCISASQKSEVKNYLREECKKRGAVFIDSSEQSIVDIINSDIHGTLFNYSSEQTQIENLYLPLPGFHQIDNAKVALFCVAYLKRFGFTIKKENIINGLKNLKWEGRLQVIKQNPLVILDVAHNLPAFETLFGEIRRHYPWNKINLLMGLLDDKDFHKIIDLVSKQCSFVGCVRPESERALDPEILSERVGMNGIKTKSFRDVLSGFRYLSSITGDKDILLVSGSHYVVGELKKNFKNS